MTRKKKRLMTHRGCAVALAALAALLPATLVHAASAALTWSEDHKLARWIESDLTPYLAETLSRHPRFRGEPMTFVSVEGDRVREDMDDLTRDVIKTLRHRLQKTAGIHLVWQGDRFEDVPCHEIRDPEYQIAIEFVALGNHRYRVAVRALDVRERSWVSGFGREWEGLLSRAQRLALGRRDGGGDLLGLRAYPYSEAQADLLARHLAGTLRRSFCGHVGEPLVVYPETAADAAPLVNKTLGLIGSYLSRSRDVAVTDSADEANVVLTARTVRIDDDLHQFWVSVRPVQRDRALPDLERQAYVQLRDRSGPRLVEATPTSPRPPETGLAVPRTEPVTVVRHVRPDDLLSSLAVVAPRDPRNCRSANPWRFGNGVRSADNRIDQDGCFAIEMVPQRDARVFLINVHEDTELVRLLPSSCRRFGRIRTAVRRGEALRFPSPDKGSYHVLAGPGRNASETFYAIAVSDRRAADRIDEHVSELADACNAGRSRSGPRVDAWLREMRAVVADLGDRAQMESLTVTYVPRRETLARSD